jgi:hypothetical protein
MTHYEEGVTFLIHDTRGLSEIWEPHRALKMQFSPN